MLENNYSHIPDGGDHQIPTNIIPFDTLKDFSSFSPGILFGDLLKMDLPENEEVIHCLPRGYVGTLNAVTNVGKSTLVRNLTINLCTGNPFPPFSNSSAPRKVAILDFEDTLIGLRNDLITMCSQVSDFEKKLASENLLVLCDEKFPDHLQPSLSEDLHFEHILKRMEEFVPDLIIVDTISSAFRIKDENNNAEVRNSVMAKLRLLARESNAAVLATHHIGKSNSEGGANRESIHKARGASSLVDQSWLVLNLSRDRDTNSVLLECAKAKGPKFSTAVFSYDSETRLLSKGPEVRSQSSLYQQVLRALRSDKLYYTHEIVGLWQGNKSAAHRFLKKAGEVGDIDQVAHGRYRKVSK